MIARALPDALRPLARTRGVRAVLLTSLDDALPIEWGAHVDVDVDALAAFATALYRRCAQATQAISAGGVRFLALDATGGRLVAAARGSLLLVVLGAREVGPGQLRVALRRALEGLD